MNIPTMAQRIERFCRSVDIEGADGIPDIGKLLEAYGNKAFCKGCSAPIAWVKHSNGKNTPYDLNDATIGTNHFVTCPERAQFGKGPR